MPGFSKFRFYYLRVLRSAIKQSPRSRLVLVANTLMLCLLYDKSTKAAKTFERAGYVP